MCGGGGGGVSRRTLTAPGLKREDLLYVCVPASVPHSHCGRQTSDAHTVCKKYSHNSSLMVMLMCADKVYSQEEAPELCKFLADVIKRQAMKLGLVR